MSRALALVDSSDESRKHEQASAAIPLLETKLYVPRSRGEWIARPRLTEALRSGLAQKLTLVVAPAGFGKTTLLSAGLANAAPENAIAWVSLDPSDNEPTLFWAYVVRALQNIHPAIGTSVPVSTRSPSIETIITSLINDIDRLDRDVVLVLDDYHVIDAPAIHGALTLLLDHLPRRMHLVLASRSEPPLPLPRLRARGELTEVRAGDLRFTADEASAFLTKVMALDISPVDAATLERRTEGWIAGLKLAALSMKGRDVRTFVDGFSGDNRYIADYLVSEVLQSEPEHVRRFLLGTAILDRMNGALCDAVMGERGSHAMLEDLERRSLFVVALDDRREWYRYQHLFADVLQKQSVATDPDAARRYHARAAAWYETHGSSSDAVHHALASQDVDRAADLLERTWPEKNRSYDSARWLACVKTLPDAAVRNRPVLSMAYAWGLLNSGELEAAAPRLEDVERLMPTIADAARRQSLSTELASARVYLAQALGDTPGTLEHAKRTLEQTPEGDNTARATGIALVALAHWGRGELDAAHRTFSASFAMMRACGHELDAIRGTFVLGDIRAAQGRLRDAAKIYEHGLQLAKEAAHAGAAETDELYLGLSELHREWNDLASATNHLEMVRQTAEHAAYKGNRLRWRTAMARVCEARGDLDGALELLNDAEQDDRRDPIPRARPVPAIKARIRVAQGRIDDATDWLREAKVSVDDDLGFLREFEHITLARILIARSATDVVPFLERLRVAAQSGGRTPSVIEILVLHALAQHSLGNLRGALDVLSQALSLAEPEEYLRVFLDEGDRMRELLKHAIARGLAGEYARRVLVAFDAPKQTVAPAASSAAPGLVQSLTTRELEILRLIAAGLRNQEIADHLSISAATVKRHIANAYGKLGVTHRTEALARAKELRLL